MSNKVKDININNHTYYFFDDIISIKHFDPNNTKTDEKSYKNILIYYIGYVTIKDSKYVKNNSVNPLYLIFSKVNGYFEEINKNKYLTLDPTDESKEIIKQYEELWSNSDDDLPLNKTLEIHNATIVVRDVFYEENKYYLQVFLDE